MEHPGDDVARADTQRCFVTTGSWLKKKVGLLLFNESHEEYEPSSSNTAPSSNPTSTRPISSPTSSTPVWRIRRIQRFETAAIDLRLDETSPVLYEKFTIDITAVEAASFQDLAQNSRVLDVIQNYESRYYRILQKAERDLQRYRQTRSQRASRPGKGPGKPSQGGSFWNRLFPTLLLSILLISCFSPSRNSSPAPSNFRRIVALSPPDLRLPVRDRKPCSQLNSHPEAKKPQDRAVAHHESSSLGAADRSGDVKGGGGVIGAQCVSARSVRSKKSVIAWRMWRARGPVTACVF
ncbi:MAG: hypothetical protein IT167_29845 [Bryobacterales bacterium]|nr:hypothetical protein [Bryobacterales bacterium]